MSVSVSLLVDVDVLVLGVTNPFFFVVEVVLADVVPVAVDDWLPVPIKLLVSTNVDDEVLEEEVDDNDEVDDSAACSSFGDVAGVKMPRLVSNLLLPEGDCTKLGG